MRLADKARKLFAVGFVAGIGTIGVQDVDADGATDFTVRGRRRPMVERPVEPAEPDEEASPFCVLDIETTGLSPGRDSIIEIAVIRSETQDGVTRERVLNEPVRPSGNIPKHIRELTGITNETVADADTIDQVLPRVAAFVGDVPIVAHNAHFDRRFLEHNARLMGRTFAGNEWVCTMRMAQRVPLGRPYKLGALAERLDVRDQGSHRALDDCRATIGVYRAVRRLLGGSVSLAPLAPPDDGPAAEVAYDADLNGQVFVFTGFRDEVLAARIGNAGGTVAGGISRKVTTLLVADADAEPDRQGQEGHRVRHSGPNEGELRTGVLHRAVRASAFRIGPGGRNFAGGDPATRAGECQETWVFVVFCPVRMTSPVLQHA